MEFGFERKQKMSKATERVKNHLFSELAYLTGEHESLYDLYIRGENELIPIVLEKYYPRTLRYYRANLIQSLIDSGDYKDFFIDAIEANDELITLSYPIYVQEFIMRYIFEHNLREQFSEVISKTFPSSSIVGYIEERHQYPKGESIVDMLLEKDPSLYVPVYRKLGDEKKAQSIEVNPRILIPSYQYAQNKSSFTPKIFDQLTNSDEIRTRVVASLILKSFLKNPNPELFANAYNIINKKTPIGLITSLNVFHPNTYIYAYENGIVEYIPGRVITFVKTPSSEILEKIEKYGIMFFVVDDDMTEGEYERIRDSPFQSDASFISNAFKLDHMEDVRERIRSLRKKGQTIRNYVFYAMNKYQKEEFEKILAEK